MQKLVNEDDLGRFAIPISEFPAAHANDLRARACERHDGARLTLRCRAIADRLGKGALPVKEALDIARQTAEALEAAHQSA